MASSRAQARQVVVDAVEVPQQRAQHLQRHRRAAAAQGRQAEFADDVAQRHHGLRVGEVEPALGQLPGSQRGQPAAQVVQALPAVACGGDQPGQPQLARQGLQAVVGRVEVAHRHRAPARSGRQLHRLRAARRRAARRAAVRRTPAESPAAAPPATRARRASPPGPGTASRASSGGSQTRPARASAGGLGLRLQWREVRLRSRQHLVHLRQPRRHDGPGCSACADVLRATPLTHAQHAAVLGAADAARQRELAGAAVVLLVLRALLDLELLLECLDGAGEPGRLLRRGLRHLLDEPLLQRRHLRRLGGQRIGREPQVPGVDARAALGQRARCAAGRRAAASGGRRR